MATSGSIRIEYSNWAMEPIDIYVELSWRRISVSTTDNTSTVAWELKEINESKIGYAGLVKESYTVWFAGEEIRGEDRMSVSANETRVVASGTKIINHNADGTYTLNYNFAISRKNIDFGTISQAGYAALDPIIRPAVLTKASSFNDEANPVIEYSNPFGDRVTSLQAGIAFVDGTFFAAYRDISKTGTSYTFSLTSAERQAIRKKITSGNSIDVFFYLKTVSDGQTLEDKWRKSVTLINYEPTLTPDIKDTNARTIELTGDSNKLIKYYSNASVTFGAVARKEATLIDRRVICGSTTIEIEDRAQDTTIVNAVDSNTFYMRARDSRGYIVERAPVKALVEYIKLTNNLTTQAISSTGNLTFTIKGKYFNGSFGAKRNSLEVEYRVVDENGDPVFNTGGSGWVALGTVTPTVSNGDYTYSYTITGLDYTKTYTLTVNAIDELTPVQTSSKVIAAIPLFDWDNSNFKHHTNVYLDNNKTLRSYQADGSDVQILGLNASNGTVLGWGGYDKSNGDTGIYGNNVRLHSKNNVLINGSTLADFVVEQGSVVKTVEALEFPWFYRKWNSGRVELIGYRNIREYCYMALGALYRTAVLDGHVFPFNVYNPRVTATYESQGYGGFVWPTTLSTETKTFDFYLVRPLELRDVQMQGVITFNVSGTWK